MELVTFQQASGDNVNANMLLPLSFVSSVYKYGGTVISNHQRADRYRFVGRDCSMVEAQDFDVLKCNKFRCSGTLWDKVLSISL